MAGTYRWILGILCMCLAFDTGYAYIKKYSEEFMCNGTIVLGDYLYAVSLDFDFLLNDYKTCRTAISIPDNYHVAYRFLSSTSIFRTCETRLKFIYSNGQRYINYKFCDYDLFHKGDVILENPGEITLDFRTDLDVGEYEMLMYVFKPQTGGCDRSHVRCRNGRCIDRGLFCDSKYDFCGDNTITGQCSDDYSNSYTDDYTYNKLSVIGPVCLGLFTLLILLFVLYFCCKNNAMRRLCGLPEIGGQRQRSRELTARDVYIINVTDAGGTPEEGYDYVMDYKKFTAPPEYSSLENIADASVRYVNNNSNSNNDNDNIQSAGASNDVVDGTTMDGTTNEGFIQDVDDELPAYDHVMGNAEEYNVNHNHL